MHGGRLRVEQGTQHRLTVKGLLCCIMLSIATCLGLAAVHLQTSGAAARSEADKRVERGPASVGRADVKPAHRTSAAAGGLRTSREKNGAH